MVKLKVCRSCGAEKPIEDYYNHPQMGDGHLNICKECVKNNARTRREDFPEKVRAYDRKRSQNPNRVKARLEYAQRKREEKKLLPRVEKQPYRRKAPPTIKHGLSKSKTYLAWRNLKSRCDNKNDIRYKSYGARGITVCDEWQSFEAFYRDMGEAPESMSIDRKDNDGPYCKENCRWATNKEQGNNKTTNHVIDFAGKKQTLTQWAREIGLSPDTLERRINKLKMPINKALTMPLRPKKSKTGGN